jgi:PAS domain S-box-containing protein
VDDDEVDRLAVRRSLQQSGIRVMVDEATSAAEAQERIGLAVYDCVLLDYYIPSVEGLALLSAIRASVPDIPVVIFTGRGDEEMAVELMKAGAVDYLPKASLTPERMASSLRYATELARTAAAQRLAEQELRTQETRFRTLANAIPQLAWMADPSGSRYWFNERWYQYTGTTIEEMQGWEWQKLHHPDHLQRVVSGLRHSFESGEPWEDTFPLRGADGEYRWFLSRALPIRGNDEGIVGWLGTNTDITEQKRAEEERTQLYEAERAAREETEAAIKARDAFVSALSHDLKNPLTAIRGQVQILRRRVSRRHELDVDDLLARLALIENGSTRMVGLINELLDATRLEAGHSLDLELGPTDLVALARDAVLMYQHVSKASQLRFETTLPALVGTWDAGRLERVLANLLSNAIKYSPAGSEITVGVSRDNDWGVLTVEDHGIGISAQDIPQIFERYWRASNVAGSIPGTGLGLAGARDIVDQHGGSIVVQSEEGLGTTFVVRLPGVTA